MLEESKELHYYYWVVPEVIADFTYKCYRKDGKRSLNKMENISLIKVHSLYLKKCI